MTDIDGDNRRYPPGIRRREAMHSLIADLAAAGVEDASLDARALLCAAAGIEHVDLIRDPEQPLDEASGRRLSQYRERRLRHEPVSRILGTRGFWSLDLEVTSDVLDPRPDTEALVDAALEHFADRQSEPLRVADLGTGSGALLCALLDVFPNAHGEAIDISAAACNVARRNLMACGFVGRFTLTPGDWEALSRGPFDIIVSNPPYIRSDDIAYLPPEVRDFDPRLALDGGPDGLAAYRLLAPLLRSRLAPKGLALLEVGYDQAEAVADILVNESLNCLEPRRDFGGHQRVVMAGLKDFLRRN